MTATTTGTDAWVGQDARYGFTPADLPGLRADAIDEIRQYGPQVYRYAVERGCQVGAAMLAGSPAQKAAVLTRAELDRLERAELFYVAAPMTRLTVAAARTLPEFTLMPADLPAQAGLMVFDEPIGSGANELGMVDGMLAPVVACSWSVMALYVTSIRAVNDFVWFTWYSDRDRFHDHSLANGLLTQAEVAARRAAHRSRLTLDNETFVACTPTEVATVTSVSQSGHGGGFEWISRSMDEVRGDENDTLRWAAIAKTAFLLMDQSFAATTKHVYSRTERKLVCRRTGVETPPPVRVVTLRRPERAGGGEGGGRDYRHQWVVRGHWRNQWHPSRRAHRPRWINPHVKGPDGAPLLGGERVHAWTR